MSDKGILCGVQLYPNTVHVTAVKVEYKTPTNRINKGVATSWLATKVPNEENPPQVPIFIRKSQFRYVKHLLSANWCVGSAVLEEASSELLRGGCL